MVSASVVAASIQANQKNALLGEWKRNPTYVKGLLSYVSTQINWFFFGIPKMECQLWANTTAVSSQQASEGNVTTDSTATTTASKQTSPESSEAVDDNQKKKKARFVKENLVTIQLTARSKRKSVTVVVGLDAYG